MDINRFVLGDFATNCYVVRGPEPGRCLLIDPAGQGPQLAAWLEAQQLQPAAVLLTHGHYDQILAVPALQERWPALPVYCHPLDVPEALTETDMGQVFPTVAACANLQPLADGQTRQLAGLTLTVLHTPGHTPGSVCLCCEDVLFSGDTLFCESIGRTDFEGGDDAAMAASLARLAALPGDWQVLPGHEDPTTMAHERRYNPWLRRA